MQVRSLRTCAPIGAFPTVVIQLSAGIFIAILLVTDAQKNFQDGESLFSDLVSTFKFKLAQNDGICNKLLKLFCSFLYYFIICVNLEHAR